jgi:hypothetical protein
MPTLTPGDLHDARGRLLQRGWATREVLRYRRARVRAFGLRRKEWDYYCVLGERHGVALTVADNDYFGFLGVTWLDFEGRRFTSRDVLVPFPLGRLTLPESADAGDVQVRHGAVSISYRHEAGGRRLTFSAPEIAGEIVLAKPDDDRMVIATPFAGRPRHFYYNQKINCLPASGQVTAFGQSHAFTPERSFGVLDWGRGAWTYDNTWYWGSASGLVDGPVGGMAGPRRLGFNIGHGFGDTSAASENMVFLDGVAHKLDQVTFHLPASGALDASDWRFTSNDGRFEMTFTPILDRASDFNLGLIASDQHQVFGRYNGTVVHDSGERLAVRDLIGFAEKVHNRW